MYLRKYTWMPILERRYYMKHNKIKKSTFDFSAQPPDFSLQNVIIDYLRNKFFQTWVMFFEEKYYKDFFIDFSYTSIIAIQCFKYVYRDR